MKRTKRKLSAAMVAAIITIASAATVFAGAVIHGIIIQSNKETSRIDGLGASVSLGESYYHALLAGDTGEVYALTDNDYESTLTDYHAIVWKSMDQGDTWEAILLQPAEMDEGSYLIAGDLRKGTDEIEAIVIMTRDEENANAKNSQINQVYQITADSCTEYNMDEVYTQLGGSERLWVVKYVNDHIIALAGIDKCLLYDINTQKIVKSLPFDMTMGFLQTQDQFLLYGKEIYSCLDAETLEEKEPEEGLQEFVRTMLANNDNEILPPMAAWNDTIVCVTKRAIYEYRDGETTLTKQLTNAVNDGRAFNGILPFCKTQDGAYYVCAWGNAKMALWQIDGDKEEKK